MALENAEIPSKVKEQADINLSISHFHGGMAGYPTTAEPQHTRKEIEHTCS